MKESLKKLRRRWRAYRNRPKLLFPHGDRVRGSLSVGQGTLMSRGVEIDCTGNVEIGEHCVISEGVKIYSHTHDFNEGWVPDITREKGIKAIRVTIGNNVSIGAEALILPKVGVIADNAVIGARAVVTKPVGRCEIWAGNPARKTGERPQPEP